ncbi:MAG: four helix bundle protein [Candidatus Peribacter sp.]|nr:four helix bundle protein [Candidatus Peribacter sp.]
MSIQSFKDLIVWKQSMKLVQDVYLFTSRLPGYEKFRLGDQMRRCAVSIPSNIAEGRNRSTRREFAHFLRIALGSSAELETQLLLTERIHHVESKNILLLLDEVQKMLSTVIRKLEGDYDKHQLKARSSQLSPTYWSKTSSCGSPP